MIASLPMYDTVATAAANDNLWRAAAGYLGCNPVPLDRTTDPHSTWEDPDLLVSQTCGLPYRRGLHKTVSLVGTPDYGVQGCPPGYYNSVIIVREDDTREQLSDFDGARLARNDLRSQSGWAAIVQHVLDEQIDVRFAPTILETGAHAASAQAVAASHADIAALDAVTWQLLCRDTDKAKGLRVLDTTRPTPGLPLITLQHSQSRDLFVAFSKAIEGLNDRDRDTLYLKGMVSIPKQDYLAIATPA